MGLFHSFIPVSTSDHKRFGSIKPYHKQVAGYYKLRNQLIHRAWPVFVLSCGFRFDEQIGEKPNLLNCTETSDNLRETLV